MNKKPRPQVTAKKSLFSAAVFTQIARMVEQGLDAREIAAQIGCTLGSLRVKCSQYGISLRRNSARVNDLTLPVRLNITISNDIALHLQRQGLKEGLPRTKLAALLIETIVQDELYHAVLDHESMVDGRTRVRRHAGPAKRGPAIEGKARAISQQHKRQEKGSGGSSD